MQGAAWPQLAALSQSCTWRTGVWDDSVGPHGRTDPGQGFTNCLLPSSSHHWLKPTPSIVHFSHLLMCCPISQEARDFPGPWGQGAGMAIVPPVVHPLCVLLGLWQQCPLGLRHSCNRIACARGKVTAAKSTTCTWRH